MSLLKKILIIFFFLIPFSNSFAGMVTESQNLTVGDGESKSINGVDFNTDGTKMFVLYQQQNDNSNDPRFVDEYNLSTPFDISTASYAGDSERCELDDGSSGADKRRIFDLDFTKDGLSFFHSVGNAGSNDLDLQAIHRYDLTSPFDISTCTFANDTVNLNSDALQNDSLAGDHDGAKRNNRAQGVEINDDGTKLFVLMTDASNGGVAPDRILEYNFSTPFDLTTISLRLDAGIELPNTTSANSMSLEFGAKGKRLFVLSHNTPFNVTQISLDKAFDTSSFTIDGSVNLNNINLLSELRTVTFTNNGFRMFIGNDFSDKNPTEDNIFEFNLVCPFNIIEGKCPPITENKVRTGMAMAQIEIAERTIDHSTDTALNRLKWIRRNKDKQNLTNLNIDFNFTNQRLASLTEAVKTSAAKKKKKDKEEDVFYWSEGSIAIGRIGDTSTSSTKKFDTDAITFGADKFTDENGIKGWAFRIGRNNVDVGNAGSNVDTDSLNITFYSTSPLEDDTKSLDGIIGFGKLNYDLLTVIDGKKTTAGRDGNQMYGTIRIKDEIKKDNLTLIPSGRFDIGYTYLGSYIESGVGAIDVESQSIISKKIRAGLAAVDDLSNNKYDIKRHGKIEYVADIDRSSNFRYHYAGDSTENFSNTLETGALHNINGEIGIDIILPDRFSIFLIYERNQALGSGHTDKLHIALGYLPNKETNFAFSIDAIDNFKSNYVLSKNINNYNIDLKLTNDLMRPKEYDEVLFNLGRKF